MRMVRRRRGAGRIVNVIGALVVSGLLLYVLAAGFGTVPPLGAALDPGRGAWTSATGGQLPGAESLHLTGLRDPVTVSFGAQGVPSIQAATGHDAYLALGYVEARFRLAEMDSERRLGEGRLAQLAGPSELASDRFELRLGLLRTAQREWAATPRSSPAGQALLGYVQGVNDDIAQVRAQGDWPAEFSLTRVYPGAWTPVDSLVIQGVLTQELDFTTTPLDYALLERSLGAARTMAWFPVDPPNQQSPFDPGPYRNSGLTQVPADLASSAPVVTTATSSDVSPPSVKPSSSAVSAAAGQLLAQLSRLPAGLVHRQPDSNAWAANGPAVDGHGAMLAGDPHLPQTLPSIWYEAAMSAPGLDVSGVTIPGVPGVLIGHNQHIAWSLTDTQNQAALFYAEQTSSRHPGQYYWRGAWRPMTKVHYTIPVRGGAAVSLTVDVTVHGPIMTQAGQTMAVDWMGNVPSADLAALIGIDQASDFGQFRAALASWHAPTQNFVYADDEGHIGEISAGYYPQVAHGDPWLPLSGTGADDIDGVIPYAAVPQVFDPPGHVLATANQRPVGPSYPYYVGTTADFFDNSFRANQIYTGLRGRSGLRPADFTALQGNVTDNLAAAVVPKLVAALRQSGRLSQRDQAAVKLLSGWDGNMTQSSAAASVWWTFWGDYLSATFQPWWTSKHVPVSKDRPGLALSSWPTSLTEDLAAWTTGSAPPSAFSLPSGAHGTAAQVMRQAFGTATAHLASKLGGAPATWTWGKLHTRQFPSLTGADALGYGPRASSGDAWTVDAAEGGLNSGIGPSWRMVVDFSGSGSGSGAARTGPELAEGVYPGGQSENPASPWYDDLISPWWADRSLPMPTAGASAGALRWTLHPPDSVTAAEGPRRRPRQGPASG
ncbi:MAG TPA: penicillin acylase family protein [Streptosporangiaceae bacterium]|nr:penicillin acylase family protein [Streptosporangiaceae bacterium]